MRREIIAVCLLTLLLGASLLNIRFADSKMDALAGQVTRAGDLAEQGKSQEAATVLAESLTQWQKLDRYAHIMLRHDEIDPITDEYYSLLDELSSSGEATSASFETLKSRILELAEMEHLTFASVF